MDSKSRSSDPYLWGLPLLAAATTYLQSLTMVQPSTDPQAQATQRMMNIFLPVMIFMAARGFAAGLALYWVIGNIFLYYTTSCDK